MIHASPDLSRLARMLCENPPTDPREVAQAIAPLFQQPKQDVARLFPGLLAALEHPRVAPAVLDLANYLFRSGSVPAHPAAAEREMLASLLSGVVRRLGQLQQSPPNSEEEIQTRQQQVADGVALAVTLCDALGLIGDATSSSTLHDAMTLAHRRIRVEAAAALARLGDDDGVQVLIGMAQHPVTRLRAIHYAEELGLTDHVDEQFLQPAALAEAQLASWLSEPTQFGAPPSAIELVDQRTMFWPSYDDPQDCFLFRFAYRTPEAEYANIGIAGPLVHAFHVDLSNLSTDDTYAAFAGWQAEHPDIHQFAAEDFSPAHQAVSSRLSRRLADEGFTDISPVLLGVFFGEAVLVAIAAREGRIGVATIGNDDPAWFPRDAASPRPLGPHEAWAIWKGRRLLTSFNE